MKTIKIFATILLSVFLTTNIFSQGHFSAHIGPAIPVSDFGSDDMDDEDAGWAATGLNLGLQYIYPISENTFGIFGGIDFNYNTLQKDVREDLEAFYEDNGIHNADFKFNKYINVPVTAGINMNFPAGNNVGIFANAGLALNFLKITDFEIEAAGESYTEETSLATRVGFKIGGGFSFGDKYLISLDYLPLGTHDIDGEMKVVGLSENFDGEVKVDIVTFTIGMRLGE